MNEAAPDAVNYAEFAKYSIDYTVAENQEGFLAAYKGTFQTLTKVVLIGSEVLAAPEKAGSQFVGWFDENDEKVTVIEKACTLTAKWAVVVSAGDDLVAVLNAANAGETIQIEAGDYDLSGYAFTKDVTIYVIPNTDSMVHSLELRLFNVATSRAKDNTYIICPKDILSYTYMAPLVREYLVKLIENS